MPSRAMSSLQGIQMPPPEVAEVPPTSGVFSMTSTA
jgi:hypothetical protein